MPGHQCYHCKQWIAKDEPHDCWTTTESALTAELSDDLREAWDRLRESAAGLGEQRIYASHHSIMFARRACYFFVRPKRQHLELCIFLDRALQTPLVRRAMPSSKTKVANLVRIVHRDQVEAPITDWIAEAYEYVEKPRAASAAARRRRPALAARPSHTVREAGTHAGAPVKNKNKKNKKKKTKKKKTTKATTAGTRTSRPKRAR